MKERAILFVCLEIIGTESSHRKPDIIMLKRTVWQMTSHKRSDYGN